MEFTDGLNEAFIGGMYRQHPRWMPYVGLWLWASFPHAEVRRNVVGARRTFEYQLTGIAVEGLVGIEYRFGPRVWAFGDYKLSFSSNDVDLKGREALRPTSETLLLEIEAEANHDDVTPERDAPVLVSLNS